MAEVNLPKPSCTVSTETGPRAPVLVASCRTHLPHIDLTLIDKTTNLETHTPLYPHRRANQPTMGTLIGPPRAAGRDVQLPGGSSLPGQSAYEAHENGAKRLNPLIIFIRMSFYSIGNKNKSQKQNIVSKIWYIKNG
jgi:hypothetical protein